MSVVINVVAEEIEFLPRVLSSVKGFADETVIVDMSGGGKVSEVARDYKAVVYPHEFVEYVEPARNFGIKKAKGKWILILDPDEELPSSLAKRLQEVMKEEGADYLRLPRKNLVFGKWLKHSRWWPDYNIRFFKKGCVSWNEVIHAVPMTVGRGTDLPDAEENAIVHHHYTSIEQYIERMSRYTGVQARLKIRGGYKFGWQDLIAKPVAEFVSRFFSGEGYKDGVHGLAVCLLQATSELILYLKIWQEGKFIAGDLPLKEAEEEIMRAQSEINYWKADALVSQEGSLIQRVKRKLKLA